MNIWGLFITGLRAGFRRNKVKIIDDKGKFFGIINIIDLIAVLFLFIFLRMLFFGYKLHEGNKLAMAEECEKARIAALVKAQTKLQAQADDISVDALYEKLSEIELRLEEIKKEVARKKPSQVKKNFTRR